jgi:spermidine synthase
VQPWRIIERATARDGTELLLARRGDEWVLRAGGRVLMSSRVHGSEVALAAVALARWRSTGRRRGDPRTVLLGGVGLGFTLRALLDRLPATSRVVVAELLPDLAGWVRGVAAHLAGRPLEDPRVRLQLGDVGARIAETNGTLDLILLDVDNGPSPLAHRANGALYGEAGVAACHRALRAGGVLGVWSAGPDQRYLQRLERAGFAAEAQAVAAGPGSGVRHVLLLGTKAHRR